MTQRQPKGVPVGGQFATDAHDESGLSLDEFEVENDVGWTGAQDDAPIPQANRPDVLACVVDVVVAGCETPEEVAEAIGMDKRQGGYYLNAAAHLGLVDSVHVGGSGRKFWDATDAGRELAKTDGGARAAAMADILADSEYVQMSAEGGEEAVAAECRRLGISPSTIERRVASIRAWAEFATDPATHGSKLTSLVPKVRSGAKRVIEARKVKRPQVHCSHCGMLQTTAAPDECPFCDRPIVQAG